jgi:hypothetical protein
MHAPTGCYVSQLPTVARPQSKVFHACRKDTIVSEQRLNMMKRVMNQYDDGHHFHASMYAIALDAVGIREVDRRGYVPVAAAPTLRADCRIAVTMSQGSLLAALGMGAQFPPHFPGLAVMLHYADGQTTLLAFRNVGRPIFLLVGRTASTRHSPSVM